MYQTSFIKLFDNPIIKRIQIRIIHILLQVNHFLLIFLFSFFLSIFFLLLFSWWTKHDKSIKQYFDIPATVSAINKFRHMPFTYYTMNTLNIHPLDHLTRKISYTRPTWVLLIFFPPTHHFLKAGNVS